MKFVAALVSILLFGGTLTAQNDSIKKHKVDSLTLKLQADSLHTFRFKTLRPYGNIDNRNSLFRSKPSNFNGYQLGVIVNEYHTFGVGFYALNSASRSNSPVKKGYSLRNLRYNTVFYEYLLFNKRYYEVDLPFELGYGSYHARYTDTSMAIVNKNIYPSFLPLSAGVKFVVKPVRWIGLSLMIGYRYFIEKKDILEFNNLFFPVGIWVDFRQVYRDIKYYGFQKKRYRRAVKEISER